MTLLGERLTKAINHISDRIRCYFMRPDTRSAMYTRPYSPVTDGTCIPRQRECKAVLCQLSAVSLGVAVVYKRAVIMSKERSRLRHHNSHPTCSSTYRSSSPSCYQLLPLKVIAPSHATPALVAPAQAIVSPPMPPSTAARVSPSTKGRSTSVAALRALAALDVPLMVAHMAATGELLAAGQSETALRP